MDELVSKTPTKVSTRRNFLRSGASVCAGLLAAGVLGSFGKKAFGQQEGTRGRNFRGQQHEHEGGHQDGHHGSHDAKLPRTSLDILSLEGVQTRLGILSDAHVCDYDDAAAGKLTKALETLSWMAPEMHAYFMLGDLSLTGFDTELDIFATKTAEVFQTQYANAPIMHLMMGNHDWLGCIEAQFESFFARHSAASYFASRHNTVEIVRGATIIKLAGSGVNCAQVDKMDYTVSYGFLAEALREAAANRPDDAILVMSHESPEHMSLPFDHECGYYGQGTSLDMVALMTQYPQVRMFCGHLHNPLDLPETINTDLGFTLVHTSTVGSCLFVRGTLVDKDEEGSEGLVLDIREDGSLILPRLDFARQEYIGEPVTI